MLKTCIKQDAKASVEELSAQESRYRYHKEYNSIVTIQLHAPLEHDKTDTHILSFLKSIVVLFYQCQSRISFVIRVVSFKFTQCKLTLLALSSHTLSTNGWSIKSGPPMLRFSTSIFLMIA